MKQKRFDEIGSVPQDSSTNPPKLLCCMILVTHEANQNWEIIP